MKRSSLLLLTARCEATSRCEARYCLPRNGSTYYHGPSTSFGKRSQEGAIPDTLTSNDIANPLTLTLNRLALSTIETAERARGARCPVRPKTGIMVP
jgi:hypothetical protein